VIFLLYIQFSFENQVFQERKNSEVQNAWGIVPTPANWTKKKRFFAEDEPISTKKSPWDENNPPKGPTSNVFNSRKTRNSKKRDYKERTSTSRQEEIFSTGMLGPKDSSSHLVKEVKTNEKRYY
jgi:hypothetical protein